MGQPPPPTNPLASRATDGATGWGWTRIMVTTSAVGSPPSPLSGKDLALPGSHVSGTLQSGDGRVTTAYLPKNPHHSTGEHTSDSTPLPPGRQVFRTRGLRPVVRSPTAPDSRTSQSEGHHPRMGRRAKPIPSTGPSAAVRGGEGDWDRGQPFTKLMGRRCHISRQQSSMTNYRHLTGAAECRPTHTAADCRTPHMT